MERSDRALYSRPGALIFSLPGLGLLAVGVVIAAVFHNTLLAGLAALLAAVGLLSLIWAWQAVRNLEVREILAARRLFPGEMVSSHLSVANHKGLPVAWMEINRPVQGGLALHPGSPYRREGDLLVCRLGWLLGHQEASWQLNWQAGRRGVYRMEPLSLCCGDPGGFFGHRVALAAGGEELMVYPCLFSVPEVAPGWQEPPGELCALDFRFADPLLLAGVRDYQPGDSLRRINWVASARGQSLKANLWDGSVQVRSLLCLETATLASLDWPEEQRQLAFELLASAAASLTCSLTKVGEVGLLSDIPAPGENRLPCYLPPAANRGSRQAVLLLETLARLQPAAARPPEILTALVRLPARSNMVVLTACWSEALATRWAMAWPGRSFTWLALSGELSRGGREVQPLFPGWEEDLVLKQAILGELQAEALV